MVAHAEFQIFNPVIGTISVSVVNGELSADRMAKVIFHDEDMLKHPSVFIGTRMSISVCSHLLQYITLMYVRRADGMFCTGFEYSIQRETPTSPVPFNLGSVLARTTVGKRSTI